jgi:ubiquinone/menaquinone biosynthesis C-methylase UbiE
MTSMTHIQHPKLKFVDHGETYGRHILDAWMRNLKCDTILDLGCGSGSDLEIAKRHNPQSHCIGVEYSDWAKAQLLQKGIDPITIDIECEAIPYADESLDLIIGNQILEHTKEIFWINHEVFRTLKVGGHFYLSVPNVLAWHNRLLGLTGRHPTCVQLCSAHVRAFSKRDTLNFYRTILPQGVELVKFAGAQFYPFPKPIARSLATIFPNLSVSIFFLLKKTSPYQSEFLNWLNQAQLETNYYAGK